jgi:mRNA interferase RelE/StbE
MKTIIFTKQAAKDLDALQDFDRDAIIFALSEYAVFGRGDIKALSGRDGFRMRVGSFRILFDEDKQTILAVYIGRRETTTYKKN